MSTAVVSSSSITSSVQVPLQAEGLPWHVAPLGRMLCSIPRDDDNDVLLHVLGLLALTGDAAASDIAWELLVLVQSAEGALVWFPCPSGWSMCRIHEAVLSESSEAVLLRGIALPRCRGGKGGFGKNLAKKGRLYIKAQRRGETNANLNQLARNLRGERIGDAPHDDAPRHNVDARPQRQLPEEVEAAYAEVRREHEHKTHERDAFAGIIREAVLEGYRASVDVFLKDQKSVAAAGSDSH
jgi:hypothetical protein